MLFHALLLLPVVFLHSLLLVVMMSEDLPFRPFLANVDDDKDAAGASSTTLPTTTGASSAGIASSAVGGGGA